MNYRINNSVMSAHVLIMIATGRARKGIEKVSIFFGFCCRALERRILTYLETVCTKIMRRLIGAFWVATASDDNIPLDQYKRKVVCKGLPVLRLLIQGFRFSNFASKRILLLLERDNAALKSRVEFLECQRKLPEFNHLVHQFRTEFLTQNFSGNTQHITR